MDFPTLKAFCASSAIFLFALTSLADASPVNWPIEPLPANTNAATFSVPRNDWMQKFERNCKRGQSGPVDLLFQGDSITEGWGGTGQAVWKERYAKLNPASFGISGDRTENVIWRIRNGELNGISPKLVVIMIGTNNSGRDNAAQIAEGVAVIVHETLARCPNSQILLLGVFPRGEKASDPIRAKIAGINRLIEPLGTEKSVHYLDIGKSFLSADGSISRDIMPDFLHPSAAGYKIWADQIQGEIDKYLGSEK